MMPVRTPGFSVGSFQPTLAPLGAVKNRYYPSYVYPRPETTQSRQLASVKIVNIVKIVRENALRPLRFGDEGLDLRAATEKNNGTALSGC